VTNTRTNSNTITREHERGGKGGNEEQRMMKTSSSLELKYRATVALFQTHANAFEALQRKLQESERDVKRETTEKEALAKELESKKEATRTAQRHVGNGSKSGKYLARAKGIRNVHHAHKSG